MRVYIIPSGTHRQDILFLATSTNAIDVRKMLGFPLARATKIRNMEANFELITRTPFASLACGEWPSMTLTARSPVKGRQGENAWKTWRGNREGSVRCKHAKVSWWSLRVIWKVHPRTKHPTVKSRGVANNEFDTIDGRRNTSEISIRRCAMTATRELLLSTTVWRLA